MSETVPDENIPPEVPPQFEPVPESTIQLETQPVEIPDIIDLNNLINEQQVLVQRETDLKTFFNDTLISVPISTFKPKLIEWAALRFPVLFPIWSVDVNVPDVCSDGVTRGLVAYIEHCIEMKVDELMTILQPKFIDINVTYTYQNSRFSVVVVKV